MAELAMIIDADTVSRRTLAALLDSIGLVAVECASTDEGLTLLHRIRRPALIVAELTQAGLSIDTFRATQRRIPGLEKIPMLVVSDRTDLLSRAAELSAAHLKKPVDAHAFCAMVTAMTKVG